MATVNNVLPNGNWWHLTNTPDITLSAIQTLFIGPGFAVDNDGLFLGAASTSHRHHSCLIMGKEITKLLLLLHGFVYTSWSRLVNDEQPQTQFLNPGKHVAPLHESCPKLWEWGLLGSTNTQKAE